MSTSQPHNSFRPFRRQLGPVSAYWKSTGAALPPYTTTITAGPGWYVGSAVATTPQSDSIVVFTVTFNDYMSGGSNLMDTDCVVTNGTIVSVDTNDGHKQIYHISVQATANGAVTLYVNAAAVVSALGLPNELSNTGTVTFSPDENPTTWRSSRIADGFNVTHAFYNQTGTQAYATWTCRNDLDAGTMPASDAAFKAMLNLGPDTDVDSFSFISPNKLFFHIMPDFVLSPTDSVAVSVSLKTACGILTVDGNDVDVVGAATNYLQ